MSRGPESAFWKKVREVWPGHAQRVEASHGEAQEGTPDTVLSVGGRGGWVELKVWPDNVSREQLVWHVDAIERGAYAMVLSELPKRGQYDRSVKVWLGNAEEYHGIVNQVTRNIEAERIRPSGKSVVFPRRRFVPEGVDLQAALNVIRCALIGKRK